MCVSAPLAIVEDRAQHEAPLARLVAYVSMLPRSRLGRTPEQRAKVESSRRRAVERGTGSGHDPRRMRTRSQPAAHYKAPARSSRIWDLV